VKHPLLTAGAAALVSILFVIWGLYPAPDALQAPKAQISLVLDTDIGVNQAVMCRGALMAAQAFQADLTVTSLAEMDKPEQQIDLVEEQLDQGAKAVLLVSAGDEIAKEAIRLCGERGVQIVLVDACEASRGETPYVGTNHRDSGIKATQTILEISKVKKLLVLGSDDPVSLERLEGVRSFTSEVGAEIIVCEWESSRGTPCNLWVRAMIEQNSGAGAVLSLDGALSECASQELQAMGNGDKTVLGGFDCDQSHIDCLKDGNVRFTVLREPFAVGYEGVKCAIFLLFREVLESVEYIDTAVVMREDALKPENVPLVFPLI
jgi:ABC-type sugar transport system substrate-binding protein